MIYKIRKALSNFFGFIAIISVIIFGICIWGLDYVGVKIQYILVPTMLFSACLWWLTHPDKNKSIDED